MPLKLEGTRLERLNTLLKDPALQFPPFRCVVDPSGRNLEWLRRAVQKSGVAPDELKNLVKLDMRVLLQPNT